MKHLQLNNFYIFGAGSTAKTIKNVLEKHNKKVIAFMTSYDGHTSVFQDTPIVNLSYPFYKIDKLAPVIIAVFNRENNARMDYIKEYLFSFGIKKIITVYEFYQAYSKDLFNWYWLTNKDYYISNINSYDHVKSLFNEKKSIEIFNQIVYFLKTFDYKKLPTPQLESQYFPSDLEIWDGNGTFLDIGSYDGKNIVEAFSKFGMLNTVIAFEPDPNNITLMNLNLAKTKIANQIIVYPCGAWSSTEILRFKSGGGESSAISDTGDIYIQGVAIDQALFGFEIGFIKMDIEGAEVEALTGLKNLIRKFKPSLAICLYHKPEHMYSIPLLINSWDLGYNFWIRSHGNNLFDTVLYCSCKK